MLRNIPVLVVALWTLSPTITCADDLYNNPEGTTFDVSGRRWFVSNWADGNIIAVDSLGQQSVFSSYLESAAGMHIVADTLYVASPQGAMKGVAAFNLITGDLVRVLALPELTMPNDLASDEAGHLYVTDSDGGRLVKIRLSDYAYSIMVSGLSAPNGIVLDRNHNRLLIACIDGTASINAVSLSDSTVTNIVTTELSDSDGLTVDDAGYTYFSDWISHSVYKFDPSFLIRSLVADNLNGPASIFFDTVYNVLAIPKYLENRVTFISFPDTDEDGVMDVYDNCPQVPNPEQGDLDHDGSGDLCDLCTDTDLDSYGNPGFAATTCPIDNCPDLYNPEQTDVDGDGVGDACDACIDSDADGFGDPSFPLNTCPIDNCPQEYNPDQLDVDENGVGDACESCCRDRVGDANGSGTEEPTIGDISTMIDAKFISENCVVLIACPAEADVNQSGGMKATCDDITIGDISLLIDYLFITGAENYGPLSDCL